MGFVALFSDVPARYRAQHLAAAGDPMSPALRFSLLDGKMLRKTCFHPTLGSVRRGQVIVIVVTYMRNPCTPEQGNKSIEQGAKSA
jgi:hypothetical protein